MAWHNSPQALPSRPAPTAMPALVVASQGCQSTCGYGCTWLCPCPSPCSTAGLPTPPQHFPLTFPSDGGSIFFSWGSAGGWGAYGELATLCDRDEPAGEAVVSVVRATHPQAPARQSRELSPCPGWNGTATGHGLAGPGQAWVTDSHLSTAAWSTLGCPGTLLPRDAQGWCGAPCPGTAGWVAAPIAESWRGQLHWHGALQGTQPPVPWHMWLAPW